MFCIFCRRAISEDAPFCPGCGKQVQRDRPLSITCQSCQASNPDDAIFCWNCSRRLQREENAVDFILPTPPFPPGTQPPAGTVPTVQGIPQAGGAPMVHGTPSAFDAPSMAPRAGHSFSQTPASSTGQPLSQPAASSANVSPSQSPPAPQPTVGTSHGSQSPPAPHQPVSTPQTAPASASRTKISSGGIKATRRILRPRVVLALVCVAVVVAAAATLGSLAVGALNQPHKPPLSSGSAANVTQAPTAKLTQPPAPTPTLVPTPTLLPPTPTANPGAQPNYFWVTAEQDYSTQGASGNLSQHQPSVDPSDPVGHSLAEVGVFDGTLSTWTQSVEVGWIVAPAVFHDTQSHLFVSTWYNNGKEQCYVSRSAPCDFHAVSSAHYYPGDAVAITNTPQQYLIEHLQGNWWIWYKDQWIGYMPDSHWNNTFTQVKSVQWLGEVSSARTSPCIALGNGTFGHEDGSAVITHMFFTDGDRGPYPDATAHLVPHPYTNLYDAGHFSPSTDSFNSFTYGGPGAC